MQPPIWICDFKAFDLKTLFLKAFSKIQLFLKMLLLACDLKTQMFLRFQIVNF
jgi:hypothetical protein